MYWYNPSLSVLHILFSVHLDSQALEENKTELVLAFTFLKFIS